MGFSGFTTADFEAYEEHKWSSNVYNLERMKARDTLRALIDQIKGSIDNDLIETLQWSYSDEHPSIANNKCVDKQWGYAFRNQAHQKMLKTFLEKTKLNASEIFHVADYYKHVSIVFILDSTGLSNYLYLHGDADIDRTNFAARLQKPWDRDMFIEKFGTLDEQAHLKIEDEEYPISTVDIDFTAQLADKLNKEAPLVQIGWFEQATQVIEYEDRLVDILLQRLQLLLPLYNYVAWTKDNDHVEVHSKLEKVAKKIKKAPGIDVGKKVRIVSGIFSGKNGKVVELDERGNVKVLLGGLAMSIPIKDCQPL